MTNRRTKTLGDQVLPTISVASTRRSDVTHALQGAKNTPTISANAASAASAASSTTSQSHTLPTAHTHQVFHKNQSTSSNGHEAAVSAESRLACAGCSHCPSNLARLPFSNITHPTSSPVHDLADPNRPSLIVFDWDDTLIPSGWISKLGLQLNSHSDAIQPHRAQLHEISESVCAVLKLAMRFGPVTLITNAETGWVQLSAQLFMPLVVPLLCQLTILSARSSYESFYPDDPLRWKQCSFQERLNHMLTMPRGASTASLAHNLIRTSYVVSFGDSHVEREAARHTARKASNVRCKSVKFAERPTIEQLRRQQELLCNCLQYIFQHPGDLDLQLTVNTTASPGSNGLNVRKSSLPPSNGTESKSLYTRSPQSKPVVSG
jgi:hypothetical protein